MLTRGEILGWVTLFLLAVFVWMSPTPLIYDQVREIVASELAAVPVPAYPTSTPVLTAAEIRDVIDAALLDLYIPEPVVNVTTTAPTVAEIKSGIADLLVLIKDNDPRPGPIRLQTLIDYQGNPWVCSTNGVTYQCTPAYYGIPPWDIPR